MPIPVFLGILTLAPAVLALVIVGAGLTARVGGRVIITLAAVGALVPALCLLLVTPILTGEPLFASLAGGVNTTEWFALTYRVDSLGLYAAFGIAFLITPLLLWMAWVGSAEPITDADSAATDDALTTTRAQMPHPGRWAALALTLGLETAALTVVFADGVIWLAIAWLTLVALAWGLGEAGSDASTFDRSGLALTLAGPALWLVLFLFPALGGPHAGQRQVIFPRLTDMMGRGQLSVAQVIVLSLALAIAAGAYPFITWVRRRAALVTPAGLGALALVVLPIAVFVGARTYSVAQDNLGLWPQIGQAKPPITAGVILVLLGALTVAVSGLLALGRRDARALIAYLAVAQAGWGLVALGTGVPESTLGLTLLLGTSVLGLGAMLAALVAGGVLTSDIEPDAAGPRPLDAPRQPVHLAVWCIGAATLLGMPLFGGFVARQMITAGVLQARGLPVPLDGVAWVGELLLLLALLRATAPAFTDVRAASARVTADSDEDEVDEGDSDSTATRVPQQWVALPDVAGIVFATLALVVGIVPQVLIQLGAAPAADALVPIHSIGRMLRTTALGYTVGSGQWLPLLAWIAVAVGVILLAVFLPGEPRTVQPLFLAGRTAPTPQATDTEETLYELPEPSDTWRDIAPAFTSAWTLPAGDWLLDGTDDTFDDEAAATESDDDAIDNDSDSATGEDAATAAPDADVAATAVSASESRNGAFVVATREGQTRKGAKPGDGKGGLV